MGRGRAATYIALALVLLAGGCSKDNSSSSVPSAPSAPSAPAESAAPSASASATPVSQSDSDAITAAIQKHLADNKGINMAAMDMSVDSVTINGDQAEADATFRLKQGGTGMVMTYFLQRHANGWLVMRSQPAGGQFVHPPMDKTHLGLGANPNAPADKSMPDVTDFLKSHPAQKNN